jgi:dihydrofolate reductase (trimethoprim resistance protein)
LFWKNGDFEVSERWSLGTVVTKKSGASWTGKVVGYYSTSLTPVGYAIESVNEPGSVQIYPAAALRLV